MTVRAKVLTIVVVLALAAGAALGVSWFRERAWQERVRSAAADAVLAADADEVLGRVVRARTFGLTSRAAITRTATTTALVIERARREHAREVARRRAARAAREKRERREQRQPRPSGGLLIGDSVALGAKSCLTPLGYELDAEVGRRFDEGLQQLRQHAASGLPDTVVLELGSNGPFDAAGFAEAMALAGSERRVVWVTVALPSDSRYAFRDSLNAMITDLAGDYPNVRVAGFGSAAAAHPEWLFADGVHLNQAGCAGFTEVVDAAVRDPVG